MGKQMERKLIGAVVPEKIQQGRKAPCQWRYIECAQRGEPSRAKAFKDKDPPGGKLGGQGGRKALGGRKVQNGNPSPPLPLWDPGSDHDGIAYHQKA